MTDAILSYNQSLALQRTEQRWLVSRSGSQRGMVTKDIVLLPLDGKGLTPRTRHGANVAHLSHLIGTREHLTVDTKNSVDASNQLIINGNVPHLQISGRFNRVSIGKKSVIGGPLIIKGDNNEIDIGDNCNIQGMLAIHTSGARLTIGSHTAALNLRLTMHEASYIEIGNDCIISGNVWMTVSDMHSIIDKSTGKRINPPLPVVLEDHIWVGHSVTLLKGCRIGTGSIIGAGSIVTKNIPPYCLAAGSPAKVIRENVDWDRKLLPL